MWFFVLIGTAGIFHTNGQERDQETDRERDRKRNREREGGRERGGRRRRERDIVMGEEIDR